MRTLSQDDSKDCQPRFSLPKVPSFHQVLDTPPSPCNPYFAASNFGRALMQASRCGEDRTAIMGVLRNFEGYLTTPPSCLSKWFAPRGFASSAFLQYGVRNIMLRIHLAFESFFSCRLWSEVLQTAACIAITWQVLGMHQTDVGELTNAIKQSFSMSSLHDDEYSYIYIMAFGPA